MDRPTRVSPGQVWNDDAVRSEGGPLRVITVDSAHAYCRTGRDGDGAPCRIPLWRFEAPSGEGLTLVDDPRGVDDLTERRVLTALWQLDYAGRPGTEQLVSEILGGRYSAEEVGKALATAEREGLVVRGHNGDAQWRLTGGGRRIAAVA